MIFRPPRDNPEQRKPFLEHMEDLRRTIIRSALSLLAGTLVAIPLAPAILRIVKLPLAWAGADPDRFLRVQEVAGGLSVATRVVLWSGAILSAPAIVLFVGNFVSPGLTPRERKAIARASGFAVALFVLGVCIGYFATLPAALKMMFGVNRWIGVSSEWVVLSDYVSFVLGLLLAFGLAFEFPVVLVALGSVGIVSSSQLRARRRHVIVGILILAAVLTPSPDVLSQLLMGVPLIILYEGCIWLIRLGERRRSAGAPPRE